MRKPAAFRLLRPDGSKSIWFEGAPLKFSIQSAKEYGNKIQLVYPSWGDWIRGFFK